MIDFDQLLDEVAAGPEGPRIGAFFDFDGTLIDGYSATAFYLDRLRRFEVSPGEFALSVLAGVDVNWRGGDVSRLMRIAAQAWSGRPEAEAEEFGRRLFVERIAGMVYPEARRLVRAHQRKGHTVVLASSATRYQAGPLAADLGIEHLLCSEVEIVDGVFTGALGDHPILWGPGKARAVRDFARRARVDLTRSHGYANGDEDVPFLEAVGRPWAVNPQDVLLEVAEERGWPATRFRGRGGPTLTRLVRTGAALAGLGAAASVSIGVGLLNRSRRQAANLAASLGGDLILALGGVGLEVTGEANLWAQRPAVFIFNHQSSVDVPILAALLRRDVTAVAKREAARDPRFALVGYLAGIAYIDRSDPEQAKAALGPVVERIREGLSLAIAPEGTRSPTPTPRRFKKGAFHIAMQAGVPVVPIVIRNAGDVLWRNSLLVRPGTVQVAVLSPIPTHRWTAANLDDRVAEIEALYRDTLDRWPSEPVDGEVPAPPSPAGGADGRRAKAPPATRSRAPGTAAGSALREAAPRAATTPRAARRGGGTPARSRGGPARGPDAGTRPRGRP